MQTYYLPQKLWEFTCGYLLAIATWALMTFANIYLFVDVLRRARPRDYKRVITALFYAFLLLCIAIVAIGLLF